MYPESSEICTFGIDWIRETEFFKIDEYSGEVDFQTLSQSEFHFNNQSRHKLPPHPDDSNDSLYWRRWDPRNDNVSDSHRWNHEIQLENGIFCRSHSKHHKNYRTPPRNSPIHVENNQNNEFILPERIHPVSDLRMRNQSENRHALLRNIQSLEKRLMRPHFHQNR